MLMKYFSALALYGAVVHAFSDTSPFFAFISSDKPNAHIISYPQSSLAQASEISSFLGAALEQCPTDVYVFVSQSSVSANDFNNKNSAPHLHRLMTVANETSNWRLSYSEVIGSIDVMALQNQVTERCGAITINVEQASGIIPSSDAFPQIVNLQFPAPSTSVDGRASELLSHDSFTNTLLNNLRPRSYFVIYTSTPLGSAAKGASNPVSQKAHSELMNHDLENSFKSALHTDLKRDLHAYARQNSETVQNAPLFETYAFLSPSIFMGGIVVLILFSILYVGMTAIGSLEIPHGAFTKEMGPAAQRKQG